MTANSTGNPILRLSRRSVRVYAPRLAPAQGWRRLPRRTCAKRPETISANCQAMLRNAAATDCRYCKQLPPLLGCSLQYSRLQLTSANNCCHDCEMLLPLTAVTANSCRHYSVAVCSNRGRSTFARGEGGPIIYRSSLRSCSCNFVAHVLNRVESCAYACACACVYCSIPQ